MIQIKENYREFENPRLIYMAEGSVKAEVEGGKVEVTTEKEKPEEGVEKAA